MGGCCCFSCQPLTDTKYKSREMESVCESKFWAHMNLCSPESKVRTRLSAVNPIIRETLILTVLCHCWSDSQLPLCRLGCDPALHRQAPAASGHCNPTGRQTPPWRWTEVVVEWMEVRLPVWSGATASRRARRGETRLTPRTAPRKLSPLSAAPHRPAETPRNWPGHQRRTPRPAPPLSWPCASKL